GGCAAGARLLAAGGARGGTRWAGHGRRGCVIGGPGQDGPADVGEGRAGPSVNDSGVKPCRPAVTRGFGRPIAFERQADLRCLAAWATAACSIDMPCAHVDSNEVLRTLARDGCSTTM